ncbi:type I restriction enzyme M protein [Tahibacter aquaticus]|uniref:Type I restriction enzyme M protein n=1 Tax=Tahibacter aquaticus TaxID=520092 RepID=A0A4R6YM56_9GAMM|nr:N-6 DNA methylase [Tahibacter aquaticus]TDR38425.1 type I restriction enzyme M protein [Tahibacter aquaticus]
MAQGRTDSLGRYYTRECVASVLVDAIDAVLPHTIIDLGAGAGTLITEAAKRWGKARYLTVDIDRKAASGGFPTALGRAYRHHVGDALERNIESLLPVPRGGACVALCNPPYIRPKWQIHFRDLLEEVGLESVLPKARDLPADVLFVAQSLRLLKPGGRLGLILPDGLIAGERFASFRSALVTHHSIHQVVELPRSIFRRTEAKAHILVVGRSESQAKDILVRCLNLTGKLSEAIAVSPERACERLDYSFHVAGTKIGKRPRNCVGDFVENVSRGSYSSRTRKDASVVVFHTSDLPPGRTTVPKRFWLRPAVATGSAVTAIAGDLLVARVGRGLSKKICVVTAGKIVPSDCFLRIRPRAGLSQKLLQLLTSSRGQEALERIAHGVGARFITVQAFLCIRI